MVALRGRASLLVEAESVVHIVVDVGYGVFQRFGIGSQDPRGQEADEAHELVAQANENAALSGGDDAQQLGDCQVEEGIPALLLLAVVVMALLLDQGHPLLVHLPTEPQQFWQADLGNPHAEPSPFDSNG
jgi:hypothetical protein